MKTKLLTICLLLFTSQVFAGVVDDNIVKLKKTNDCEGCDLRNANLSDEYLAFANLSNANLSNANLSGADLKYANLSNANLSNANLSNAILDPANLSNANLSNANLSNANLDRANLSNANLSNANLFNANDEVKILLSGIYENIEDEKYQINPTDKDNFFHVIVDHFSHQRNYICDIKNKIINNIGDGGLEIKNGGIYRYWAKSYHPDWGAFWYNIKVSFSGEYLELINMKEEDKKCYPVEKFDHMSSKFRKLLKEQKLDKFCIWHKGMYLE